MEYEMLIENVQQWGKDKGFKDARAQFMKVVEELGETAEAYDKHYPDKLIDSIGDLQVTIIMFAMLAGVDYKAALEEAWNEIADRKGKMIDGVFVKESDLHKGRTGK